MRGTGRVPNELARQREAAALDLSARGLSGSQIAAELSRRGLGDVTHQGVSKMLIRVEKRMLAEMSASVKNMKVKQTNALQKIYADAMAAWEESKKPQKSLTTKHGASGENGEPGKVLESQSVLRDQDGDPRYLSEARQALADIRKIWGVDAASKVEVGGEQVIRHEVRGRMDRTILTDEQIDQLEALLAQATPAPTPGPSNPDPAP